MRKIFLLTSFTFFLASTFAASSIVVPPARLNASEIFFPIGTTGKKISLMELSTIPRTQLESMTGKKMNFFEKMAFKSAQKKLKKNINHDGTFKKKKYERLFSQKAGDSGFHIGGFALGFFLGLIGVLIAYLLNDEAKRNRVKWAWIGLGVSVLLTIILIVAVFNSIRNIE